MTLTQAEMEARYDLTRLSPIADAESIYEQQVADVARRIGKILCDAERDEAPYPNPIPLSAQEEEILKLLIDISPPDPDELATTYAERFAAGYRDGQAIARALQAEEQGADIDAIIKLLEQAE